jgi:Flp pilus assembly protein TadG
LEPDIVSKFSLSDRGATAAEFALILPAAVLFIFGIINMSLMLYATTKLHYAAEDAARCATVRLDCKDSTTPTTIDSAKVIAWAQARYKGPGAGASFSYAGAACGNQVTGDVTYTLNIGIWRKTVPLHTVACFPA